MNDDRRAERYEMGVAGKYRMGSGVSRDVRILDLSETGCRMFDKFTRLETGTELSLRIGPIGPVIAEVMWCKDQIAGLRFDTPMYGPVFDHLRTQVKAASGSF
ncbi:PilZ domain-containing protein [Sphingomonadaceae bacterium]|nr:PilZ domain-containing protein [Sphingomonadaceae bacterium]